MPRSHFACLTFCWWRSCEFQCSWGALFFPSLLVVVGSCWTSTKASYSPPRILQMCSAASPPTARAWRSRTAVVHAWRTRQQRRGTACPSAVAHHVFCFFVRWKLPAGPVCMRGRWRPRRAVSSADLPHRLSCTCHPTTVRQCHRAVAHRRHIRARQRPAWRSPTAAARRRRARGAAPPWAPAGARVRACCERHVGSESVSGGGLPCPFHRQW